MERVLIYRDWLLPLSEMFIYRQLQLQRYIPVLLGSKRVTPSIDLSGFEVQVVNERSGLVGDLNEVLFKLAGFTSKPIRRWLAMQQPRLVHAHFGPGGAMVLPLAKRLRLPLIVSFHGSDATLDFAYARRFRAYQLYFLRRRQLIEYCSAVLVPTDFVLQQLVRRHGFPEDKIVIQRHHVDAELFAMVPEPEPGRILYVGRLVRTKGLHLLLRALCLVQKSLEFHLVVIGDGPEREEYEQMARAFLGSRVSFLGARAFSSVKEELRRAWVFCMPSYTQPSGETETFGVVYAEAQAAGVPVIAFATGGVPEVVEHGETGLLAAEGNVEELAGYLALLLADKRLRDEMGARARQRAKSLFDPGQQIELLERIYGKYM